MTKEEWKHIYSLVGAAMEVYNTLGRGMQEPIYQEAMAKELELNKIPYEREKLLTIFYKGVRLDKQYAADFYSEGVIIEFKSVSQLTSDHRAQLFNYMRISRQHLGLLINFGEPGLRCERYLYQPDADDFVLLTKENYKLYIE